MNVKIWKPSDFSQATAFWKSETGTVISITSPAFEATITFSEIEIIFLSFLWFFIFFYLGIIQSHYCQKVKSDTLQILDYFFVGYLQNKGEGNKDNYSNKPNSQ